MAKEVSLRVFQQRLAERLREAQAESAPASRLGVEAAGGHWLLRLEDAGEVLPVPKLWNVPLTQSWFLGITNIRGNLASVVDFSAFTGGLPTPLTPDSRLVLLADRFQAASALVVSRLAGLKYVQRMTVVESATAEDRPWNGQAYRDEEAREWRELDMAALVQQETFLQVGI
jgi:twitching motility protein PilI